MCPPPPPPPPPPQKKSHGEKTLFGTNFTRIVITKIFTINLPSQPFLGCHLGFHFFLPWLFWRPHSFFFTVWLFWIRCAFHCIISLCRTYLLTAHVVLDSPPRLKDLFNIVTPDYAAQWKVIGTLLDISTGRLNGIERSFPANAFWCCNRMLEIWLEIDTSASWKKLIQVIDSPAVMAAGVFSSTTATNIVHLVIPIAADAGNII